MIRLVVADDQSLIRMAIRTLVTEEDDIELVAEAEDGVRALAAIKQVKPDVALLDVRMPKMDGLEVLAAVCDDPALAGTRAVMMTTFDVDSYIFDALAIGAAGFVMKDTAPAEILRAVRVVADGESLLSPAVTRKVIGRFTEPGGGATGGRRHPRLDSLTGREKEILGWVATGLSNEDIGERLFISPATVRTHVGRMMTKLSARDRAQLVVIAYRSGITIPE